MLKLEGVYSGYEDTEVLRDVDLHVGAGCVVVLLGRNGAGKSTTLKTVLGLLRPRAGSICLEGRCISALKPFEIARMGLGYVPETRDIFPSLSVYENLCLPLALGSARPGPWTVKSVLEFFPNLKARLKNGGNELSGGEQQMLAIARALLLNPKVLLLDEPTEGLAPKIIESIFDKLYELKRSDLSLLLVEQNFEFAMGLADQAYVMGRGAIQWQGESRALEQNGDIQKKWLGV